MPTTRHARLTAHLARHQKELAMFGIGLAEIVAIAVMALIGGVVIFAMRLSRRK